MRPCADNLVVPSKMNRVGDGDNQFAELFKAMPAARIGKMEDIAGAVIYLSSQAGVSHCFSRADKKRWELIGWTGVRRRKMSLRRWR